MTNYLGGDETTLKASGIDTHDGEEELPSSVELVTDDFERASLGDDYIGDTGDASIVTSPALEGDRSLAISRSSAGSSFVSYTGGDVPQLGDTFEVDLQLTDTNDVALFNSFVSPPSLIAFNGTGLRLAVNAKHDRVRLLQYLDDIELVDIGATANISSNLNEKLTLNFELSLDRTVEVRLTNSSGTELATLTTTIDDRFPKTGAVQFRSLNSSTAPTHYFDGPFITRRTTEELSERKRGATETGKLETAGGVGAGPRELPENEPAGILADQGVTSDLSAGTDVGYGLQLNGERGLELRAEADGSGGVQNSVVDLSGLNSDLRIATGQSIEDGGGTERIINGESATALNDPNGKPVFTSKLAQNQIRAYSSQEVQISDEEGGFIGLEYKPSSSAPGTLELTNADLDGNSNSLFGFRNATFTSSFGANLALEDTGSSPAESFYFVNGAGTLALRPESPTNQDDTIIDVHGSGRVEILNGSLSLPTGRSIEDGSGTRRVSIDSSSGTALRDGAGNIAFGASSVGGRQIDVDSNNFSIDDTVGAFTALTYQTSSSAPGTLSLDNALVKAGADASIQGTPATAIQIEPEPGFATQTQRITFLGDDGSTASLFAENGEIVAEDDAGNQTTLT